jgi:hypothetical protein
MKRLISLLVLVLPLAAVARPLLIPPKHLQLPLPAEEGYPGQWGPEYADVAIDGDTVLASARRTVNTAGDSTIGVYIFQRAASGTWNYAGALVEGLGTPPRVLLSGTVATVTPTSAGFQLYERTSAGWSLSTTITGSGWPERVEDGSIITHPLGAPGSQCAPAYREFRKVAGTWQQVATIGNDRCGDTYPSFNDGRALLLNPQGGTTLPLYRRATGAWPQVASFPGLGLPAISASLAYFSRGDIYRNTGGDTWVAAGSFVQPEIDLGSVSSSMPILRGANLLLQGGEGDYFLPSHDIDYNTFYETVRVYRPSTNGTASYFARLNPDFGLWGWSASEDGRRIAGIGATNNFGFEPASQLYVFEIPDSYTFTFLQQDNFESGNLSRWTPSAGQFAVAQNGSTRVLRQSSLAGNAGATLTAIDWRDQAIEADLRPLEFSGSGRWFGLVTRRTDASNYYYVTLRAPDIISLRRVQNGVVKELAWSHAPEPFVLGRSYRVRLESIGDQQAVFVEGLPRAWAKDTALTHGHPGVAGYRARFEADNVTVTGGTRLLTLQDSMETYYRSGAYQRGTGTWISISIDEEQDSFHSYLRQTNTTGDARVFSRTAITNQVVSARMQPQAWGSTTGTQDPWIGVAARVVDDRNYLYLSLRRSGQLSLRKVVNGAIQVIGTVPVPVSLQQWYDLRLEVIGNHIRGFVNGNVKFELDDSSIAGSGRSGVLMYKTSADLWAWTTYQP